MQIPKIPKVQRIKTRQEIVLEKEQQRFKNCYLFINTNFKRKSEPIMALIFMQSKIYIAPKNIGNLYFKTDDEILTIVSNYVKDDYFTCNGNIVIFGKIDSYYWHNTDGKVYRFDKNGKYNVYINNPTNLS
jgi:hypothetical protein